MKIYEYQAKEILRHYGMSVPRGLRAETADEAVSAARSLEVFPVILKAQIHAGGRGKAGGIRIARDLEAVREEASILLGRNLVTAQTGPDGQRVSCVLVEEGVTIDKELYLGIVVDREKRCPVLIAGKEGGVEIEAVAGKAPGAIVAEPVDPAFGLRPFQASRALFSLGLPQGIVSLITPCAIALYKLFVGKDCSMVEINPLAVTPSGRIMALDAKMTIDDNALFRHPDLASLADVAGEIGLEAEARKAGLNYIKLKGSVGCMVNGAGLAMATMDLIKLAGAAPANFLDVGGSATAAMIKEGLKILLADGEAKLLFINIFGGILRCDVLAEGIAAAAREVEIRLPVVARLEGTNKEKGREVLEASGINFIAVDNLEEAVETIAKEMAGTDRER